MMHTSRRGCGSPGTRKQSSASWTRRHLSSVGTCVLHSCVLAARKPTVSWAASKEA
uniref:Uncharacterized protein n=1 Tax=Amazona collaria TaxID=241587 RepID=A0A8B9IVY5_9PSIT